MSVQMQRIRAVIWPLLNPDTGLMYCDSFSWKELEPKKGAYVLDNVAHAIERAKNIKRFALLRVQPDVPAWSADPVGDYLCLIAALSEQFGSERAVLGVDVICPDEECQSEKTLLAVVEAFEHAFPHACLFIQAGSPLMHIMRQGSKMGLIVTPENMKAHVDRWKEMPLRMAVDPANEDEIAVAVDGCISILEAKTQQGSNAATYAGYRFQVRSVTLDDTYKDAHQVSVQAELANVGALPCYTDAEFRVRLSGAGVSDVRAFSLPLRAADLGPTEQITVSKTLNTEGLAPGEYDVHIGLFFDGTDYPASFGIEGRISDGYYESRLILSL